MRSIFFILLFGLACHQGIAEEAILVPERDWTSADGKTIRASLLGFEKGQGLFRTPEGRRFSIPDDRFSLRDQLPIFVARLESELEESYAKDINTDFYYSRHLPKARRRDKHNSYVALGPGRYNFAILLNDPKVDFYQVDEIDVLDREGNPIATYHLRDSDRNAYTKSGKERTRGRISVNYGQKSDVLDAIEAALGENTLRFAIRGKGGEDLLELDESEVNSIRELIAIFRHGCLLMDGGFLKKARWEEQQESPPSKGESEIVPQDWKAQFENQLSQKKYGKVTWKGEIADGVGFLGLKVVVRKSDGELYLAPFREIADEDRKRLFEKRLEEAFSDSAFEHRSGTIVYFHPEWDSKRMPYSHSILLVHHSDGNYYLRANTWTSTFGVEQAKEIWVRGSQQKSYFSIACHPNESLQRRRTDEKVTTVIQPYLNRSELARATELLESESIEFRVRSEKRSFTVRMRPDELEVTKEAIALYQWTKDL